MPSGIPESRHAFLFQAAFDDIVTPMLKYLNPAFSNRGYAVRGGLATVQTLLNVETFGSDVGVFYIDSHGGVTVGVGKKASENPDGNKGLVREYEFPMFVVGTSTPATAANEKLFKPYLDRGELIYAPFGPSVTKGLTRAGGSIYCITPEFVKKHWRFARNAFVYIDTCHSGSKEAESFRQACFSGGASVYAGWTDRVHFNWAFDKATLRLFDTLLGGSQIYQIQPRQRAFDLTAVKKYMNGQGFLHDQTPGFPGAVLTFFPGPSADGEFGLLAPSIQQMSAAVEPGKVYIHGLFDPNAPATVQVQGNGSAEFEVTPVNRSTIVVPWTGKQSPSAGKVTVMQRGHPSNTVPLSEWRLKAHMIRPYANAQREPFANIDFDLHLRADVHKPRIVPFGEPFFLGNSAIAEPHSTCQVLNVQGMYDEGRVTVEWMLPGPVVVPWGWYFDSLGSSGFKARVIFASETVVKFEAAATARDSMTVIITNREGEETRSPGDPAAISTHSGTQGAIDASYTILPGDDSSSPGAQAFGGRFSWESATASSAPDKSAPGYAE